MERVGRVSKNAAALVGARVVTSGLTFLLAVIINRNLGPEKAGIYNYAFALYTIFQVIPDFGIGNISIRDVSQENPRMRRYLSNIVSLRLLLGVLAFCLLMLTNFVSFAIQSGGALSGEKFWVVFTVAFCLMIEQPFSNSLAENFIALERLTLVALVYLIMGIVKVGLSIYIITSELGNVLILLILVYTLTYVYSIFHFYIAYRRTVRRQEHVPSSTSDMAVAEAFTHTPELPGEVMFESLLADYSYSSILEEERGEFEQGGIPPEGPTVNIPEPPPEGEGEHIHRLASFVYDRGFWHYILASAWPLAVVAAGITIYAGMDIPILSWIKGDREVGLYSAAGMFAKAFVFLTLAINMAVLPAVSKVGGKYPQKLGEIWERLMRYAWIMVIPLVVITPVLARPVLVLQEHQFIEAWNATWLTMFAMNFTFMTAISFPFFIVINKQKAITVVVLIGLAIKAVLDVVTIPLMGYMGAALTVAVSEFAVFIMLFRLLSRELGHRVNLVRSAGAPLLSLSVLYGVAFLLHYMLASGKDTFMSSLQYALIIAAALTILYIILVLVTKMLSRTGLQELNELLTV
ncbi:MAG: flippase [Actinomycetota bacterium]|nr:flippase [Actinomycetota bacterium]